MSKSETHSLSFPDDLWIKLCDRAKAISFNDKSKYVQYAVEKDLNSKKYDKIKNVIDLLVMLLGFAVIILLILVVK